MPKHPAQWILGIGDDGRQYLIHAAAPRFIAHLAPDGEPYEISGLTIDLGDEYGVLADILWFDSCPPDPGVLIQPARAAIDQLDLADEIIETMEDQNDNAE